MASRLRSTCSWRSAVVSSFCLEQLLPPDQTPQWSGLQAVPLGQLRLQLVTGTPETPRVLLPRKGATALLHHRFVLAAQEQLAGGAQARAVGRASGIDRAALAGGATGNGEPPSSAAMPAATADSDQEGSDDAELASIPVLTGCFGGARMAVERCRRTQTGCRKSRGMAPSPHSAADAQRAGSLHVSGLV